MGDPSVGIRLWATNVAGHNGTSKSRGYFKSWVVDDNNQFLGDFKVSIGFFSMCFFIE
jgi:hypothetical protein